MIKHSIRKIGIIVQIRKKTTSLKIIERVYLFRAQQNENERQIFLWLHQRCHNSPGTIVSGTENLQLLARNIWSIPVQKSYPIRIYKDLFIGGKEIVEYWRFLYYWKTNFSLANIDWIQPKKCCCGIWILLIILFLFNSFPKSICFLNRMLWVSQSICNLHHQNSF